ncbi:MAG: PorT family protein [Prolixibacteraceae bacterium]|nr:PorT family protein [Prolixibacteraceae bacterium]
MKRIVILIFLLPAIHATAQQELNKFYLGISPGVSLTRVNFSLSSQQIIDLSTEQNFTLGYNGGIVFIYYSEPRLGLQMELNYSQRGWTEKHDSAIFYSRVLNYLEFPFLSRFDIDLKKIDITITAGPTVSYLLSELETVNIEDKLMVKPYYNVIIDNRLEVGYCLGVGVSKKIKNSIIQFEIRLSHGLSEMFSEGKKLGVSTSQHQVLGVKIAYFYGWGK